MVQHKFWKNEIETSEEPYDEKEDERVGKSEEKTRYEVFPIARSTRQFPAFKRASGVFAEEGGTEKRKYHTAKQLDYELVGIEQVGDKAEAKTGEQAVDEVAEGGANAGDECGYTSF